MDYRISIVDDCASDAEYVTALVNCWAESAGHSVDISMYPSAEAFLFDCAEQRFDILLLDIEMSGMNGVELAKSVRSRDETVQLIFITGFPDFIAEGYEVSALHYLMKPVSKNKLFEVLERACVNIAKSEKRLCVTFDRRTTFIPLSKLYYIEAQKQYVTVYTEDEAYRMKASLAETEESLDEFFFKCQRSFIVNLRHVTRIKSDCVVLKNGAEVPISRGMSEKIGKEIIRLF